MPRLLHSLYDTRRRIVAACVTLSVAFAFGVSGAARAQQTSARVSQLPDSLTTVEFWKLIGDISEPGGYFRIEDNYTSNEGEIGLLGSMLQSARISGDVYIGVGPEQNYSYIAAIRPRMAFVIDIRRQAVMQHLMYKALFEMAGDRAEFISLLFAKPKPSGLDSVSGIQSIWTAYWPLATDTAMASRTYARILARLTLQHHFSLTPDEERQLKAVYDAFIFYGPSITTRGSNTGRGGSLTFADLTGYALDAGGQPRSFLSTEDNYRFVKRLHEKNLIVPVSGDFGGPKALRAIGAYVADHHSVIRAFYVSNVEQYLFQDGKQSTFYDNVARLPVDSMSVFIRPYSLRRGSPATTRAVCPIMTFLQAVAAGRVYGYNESLACPAPPPPSTGSASLPASGAPSGRGHAPTSGRRSSAS